jgi:hypothetical protein
VSPLLGPGQDIHIGPSFHILALCISDGKTNKQTNTSNSAPPHQSQYYPFSRVNNGMVTYDSLMDRVTPY